MFGKVLFENVKSNFRRALLVFYKSNLFDFQFEYFICKVMQSCILQGGVAFVAIKGILRVYHKQQQHVRQSKRTILDFNEERIRESEQSRTAPPGSSRPRY